MVDTEIGLIFEEQEETMGKLSSVVISALGEIEKYILIIGDKISCGSLAFVFADLCKEKQEYENMYNDELDRLYGKIEEAQEEAESYKLCLDDISWHDRQLFEEPKKLANSRFPVTISRRPKTGFRRKLPG